LGEAGKYPPPNTALVLLDVEPNEVLVSDKSAVSTPFPNVAIVILS